MSKHDILKWNNQKKPIKNFKNSFNICIMSGGSILCKKKVQDFGFLCSVSADVFLTDYMVASDEVLTLQVSCTLPV